MSDSVRLSDKEFQSAYEQGFIAWGGLFQRVVEDPKLPATALLGGELSQRQPPLPSNLNLKFDRRGALATGLSLWDSEGPDCSHALPPFRVPISVKVATKDPTPLSILHPENVEPAYKSYFSGDDDYVTLLILAWTYILSARWTEIMSGACSLSYTDTRATFRKELTQRQIEEEYIGVHLENVSPEEARWWAAVLSPGQGWQANIICEQESFVSPWSIRLQKTSSSFLLHATNSLPSSEEAASFSDASNYLQSFCTRHNVIDQSRAALAAVILLPSMSNLKDLRLPAPRMHQLSDATHYSLDRWAEDDIMKKDNVDRLMTLSCHTRGIRPMLLSAFYEPSIECNAVTPWLQGALAAINHLGKSNPCIVGRMCMERAPQVAYLWLGSMILGQQERLLQEVRFGQIPIDLPSAAWSGSIQSFLQQPVSKPLVVDGCVLRADECRLLFLSQCGHHSRTPVCQWKPFGKTTVEDVDAEVRAHEVCEPHQLQYKGVAWDCVDDKDDYRSPQEAQSQVSLKLSQLKTPPSVGPVTISYEGLDRDREAISENATRNIFGWLRSDGRTRGEESIWKHEWFDLSDSDEDDLSDHGKTAGSSPKLEVSARVETWLLDVPLRE